MKKIMIFAAAAALLSLSSCGKEEIKNVTDASSNGSPVFTAGINPGTKTTVNAQYGTLAWETSDVITITDGGENTATYYISAIDASTGKATFEHSSGDELGAGPYSAVYGEQPEKNQTYSATAPGKLPMSASSQDNVLTFTVQCALMEINLTKEGESVKKIEVTGKPEGKNETTYTLTCTEAVSIAEQKSFYIALPAGTYTKIVITDSKDKVCTLNVKAQGIPVTVNQIIPATFAAGDLDFLPKGALLGVFSVGPNATDKVHFSQGNLTYDVEATTNKWKFYEHQYDRADNGSASTTLISLFTWGYSASTSLDPTGQSYVEAHTTDGDKLLVYDKASSNGGDDWGVAYCESNEIAVGTWRTLSTEEWQYLFNTRTFNNGANTGDGYSYQRAAINSDATSVYGMILYPDNYTSQTDATSYTSTEWATMEENGCVFLPAAGGRGCSDVGNVGYGGSYWSSTAVDEYSAYYVFFDSFDVLPDDHGTRAYGDSVRLITESK